MDKNNLVEELHWMNWKSYMLCFVSVLIMMFLIVVGHGLLPVGWLSGLVGFAAWVVVTLLQRRMARKLADKLTKPA